VYREPANIFVAGFIGSPEMNLFHCRVEMDGAYVRMANPAFTLRLESAHMAHSGAAPAGGEVVLGIRPHDVSLVSDAADVHGTIELVELLGSAQLVHVRMSDSAEGVVRVLAAPDTNVRADDRIGLRFSRSALHLFDAESGRRLGGLQTT
jgi:ABC-type sugar transport system ATPase subunit